MLGYIFENRNNVLKSAIKLADCLGRSLRENVNLFSLDAQTNKASFVTESGFVIDGTFSAKNKELTLENVKVQSSDIFSDNNSFNNYVEGKIKNFVRDINEAQYGEADSSFTSIIELWRTRLQFNDVKKRLEEKSQAFSPTNDIIDTAEMQKFLEVTPQIVKWLNENKESISSISEIKNAVRLSNSVSKAFDIPKLNISELKEKETISFNEAINESIYEIICKQELITKELLESKKHFNIVWANNSNISNLASLIYEGNEDAVADKLSDALCDVPYLALASKKQLVETFTKALQLETTGVVDVFDKDIKKFASAIFEMKKPVKDLLIKTINEKYGVNVQNLKESVSFRGLTEAQIVIFESLYRLAPKSSIIKEVFKDVSVMLREKSGVEAIDLNDILQAIFEKAGYSYASNDYSIVDKISLNEMFSNDLQPHQIISLLEDNKEAVSEKLASIVEKKKKKLSKKQSEEMDKDDDGDIDGDDLKKLRNEENGDGGEGSDAVPEVYAPSKKKKKKAEKEEDVDRAQTPAEVQADLSGKEMQYAEAKEEQKEEAKKITKEDFFSQLDSLTKLLGGEENPEPKNTKPEENK